MKCFGCGETGHIRTSCPNGPSVKLVDMDLNQSETDLNLHSLQLYAASVRAEYPTNKPLETELDVGGAGTEQFEVDTAAFHNILTCKSYDRLRSMRKGEIPELKPETSIIKLADGSMSDRRMGSVSMYCKAENSGRQKLDFFVMKATNNLLGRYAIEKLWPQIFSRLGELEKVTALAD